MSFLSHSLDFRVETFLAKVNLAEKAAEAKLGVFSFAFDGEFVNNLYFFRIYL